MINWKYYALKVKGDKTHYFARFDKKLSFKKFKKKNWEDQLKLSFRENEYYKSKSIFFKKYLNRDYVVYVDYIKKNITKDKKILSLGSGRGISELKLLEMGYDVTLSDINYPSGIKKLKQNFKNLNFIKFDIFKNKIKKKYDVILCFNLIYAFDQKTLNIFFKKCRKILKSDGLMLLSPGGSTLNLFKFIYDKIYLPLELSLLLFLSFFKKKDYEIFSFHHGYCYSDRDIINQASKNKFGLQKKIIRGDFLTEFNRSLLISKFLIKNSFFRCIFNNIGKTMPFVNIFNFIKKK
tara:strand:- start:127 stop:1005 length:879 start_codon:yes stop_codon:yes gene_type:complete